MVFNRFAMVTSAVKPLGIAAIATHQPASVLSNDWFGTTIPRKFVHHTGIESRPISWETEASMGASAVENLQRERGIDLDRCRGIVFASPSFVPLSVARRFLSEDRVEQERLQAAGREVAQRLGIPNCPVTAINWFCSGYSKGLSIALRRYEQLADFGADDFLLVVTASRISRITDFGCMQTGPLFGDLATATLLTRIDNRRHPVHFELLYAEAEKLPADGAYFDFHLRENVLLPTPGGGRDHAPERLVFSLDGMGIADAAPRAMSSALTKAMQALGLEPSEVRFVVPHQAGTGIVRLASMKIEQLGIRGEVINGLTREVGNVSSSSIPFALKSTWDHLEGTVACPTAAVGDPGLAEVSQGCVLLRSTPHHKRLASAA
jgi:3-oxoacyl-[acyl-carrier-protein] synthase III